MTCQQDSPCISWSVNPASGSPSASPVFSVLAENDAECIAGSGLYVPKGLQVANCATFLPAVQLGQPPGVLDSVVESGSLVLTNPTDDRVMHAMVSINYGAARTVCSQQGIATVTDYMKYGIAGAVSLGFTIFDRVGGYQVEDGNFVDPGAQTIITYPGRCVPFVVCPALPAGESVEVRYQRTISFQGPTGALGDFLLQPTVISMWGLVV